MAAKDKVRDEEEAPEEQPKPKGSLLKKILLFGVLPLVLIGGTVGGLYLGGLLAVPSASEDEAAVADGEETGDEEPATKGKKLTKGGSAPQAAVYLALDPAFVVNFAGEGKARFLQITMDVMARDPAVLNHVKQHMPAIRNSLVLLFSSQTYETISTLEGKEGLREEALGVIQDILEEETGDVGIEAVYFTSIVMQ